MKDLYSVHLDEEDMLKYYYQVIDAYLKIFKRLSLEVKVVEASGGVFTDKHSHEFQVLSEVGEDTIYYCDSCDFAQNDEIAKVKEGDKCPNCNGKIKTSKAIEVGNIFPLGTMYAEKMKAFSADLQGNKKPLWLASYGIGPTRVLGTLVELFNDDKGIIWPESVAPYNVHLINLGSENADAVYEKLEKEGVDVLYDDRDVSAGQKFADADLIGIPVRLVTSAKTGKALEWKKRNEDKTEILDVDEVLKRLKKV
jgi:prolyl-tRNA synthetase